MIALKQDWLTDGLIDFEYKKYLLLAYLQQVEHEFDEKKLYPKFSELIEHYKQLELFKQQKSLLLNSFPKEISRVDFEQWKMEYKTINEDSELFKELDEIAFFGLTEMKDKLTLGRDLYEEVETNVDIFPIGILPLHIQEGYLLLSDYIRRLVSVYQYQITLFEGASEKYRSIHTKLVNEYKLSISNNYENIKWQLVKQRQEMPTPATYVMEFKHSYPLAETMLPVAKRLLVRYVSV